MHHMLYASEMLRIYKGQLVSIINHPLEEDVIYSFLTEGYVVVTVACAKLESDNVYLFDVHTLPEFRNKGYSFSNISKLLSTYTKETLLYTPVGNTAAIRLYEKLGFEQTEILMRKLR